MMKTLFVLSCFVAAALAITSAGLGDIATVVGTVTVTAAFPDTSAAPVLASVTYPTTYDSSAATPVPFVVAGSAAFTGNNTIASITITFTQGSDSTSVSASCFSLTSPCTISGGGYPKFLNDGAYTPSISVSTTTGKEYTNVAVTTAPVSVTATKYSPPTITALAFPSQAGCGASSCTNYLNGTATVTNRAGLALAVYGRVTTPTSGVYVSAGVAYPTAGAVVWADDAVSRPSLLLGAHAAGAFGGFTVVPSINTVIPSNNAMPISASIGENNYETYFAESFFGSAALQSTLVLTGGSTTDVTAPACQVASFAPVTINTVASSGTTTLTVTCTDTGGTGVASKGAFVQATGSAGQSAVIPVFVGTSASEDVSVPPYVSGTLTLIGVWAVDNAGNFILYGGCGGFALDVCGGGSSASTVSFSLFAVVVLAIFALFA